MALTMGRWIAAAAVGCALMATAFARTPAGTPLKLSEPAEETHYRRVYREAADATWKWRTAARRDSAVAGLPALTDRDARLPTVVTDRGLPAATRSLLERTVERQWRSLGIDSALVPVAVVIVVDTTPLV